MSKNRQQVEAINKLTIENKNLQNELIKIQDKLNINSSNSGLSSSSDVYRLENKSKPRSGRNPGVKLGHKYKGYEFKIPDKIVNLVAEDKLCNCGGSLSLDENYKAHQKIEIPPIKPFVTEYRLHNSYL